MLIYKFPWLYERVLKTLHGQALEQRYRKIAEFIQQGTVLDIGCGTGLLAAYLRSGIKYIGIDLNERFLKYVHKKGLDVFKINVLDVKAYPPADYYVICDLLHHINPKHQTLLKELCALNGTLIVCEPFVTTKSKLKRLLIRAIVDYDFINPPRLDLNWYTEQELIDFFKQELKPTEIFKVGSDIIAIRASQRPSPPDRAHGGSGLPRS